VVDVAFAGGDNFEKSTVPFLDALGDRLAIWIDHHEHPVGWARYQNDARFVLVPNQVAHACPELVTPAKATSTTATRPSAGGAGRFPGCSTKTTRTGRSVHARGPASSGDHLFQAEIVCWIQGLKESTRA
jgi:hypothetical protein